MNEQRLKAFCASLAGPTAFRLQQIEAANQKDKKALARLLAQEADLAQDDLEKEWLRFHAGELFIENNEKNLALEQFAKIQNNLEWKRLSLLVLEENARFENDLPRLAALYKQRAQISEPEKAKALNLLRARLLAFVLGDWKEAEKALDELAAEDPANLPVLLTRVQLYLEQGDWKKLAEAYKSLCEMGEKTKDQLVSASYAYRIAALMEGRIGSPLAAIEWYGKLFESQDAVFALPAAIEILESLKQVKELKSALQKFSSLVPDDEKWLKALLLFKQSQLCEMEGDKQAELELLKKSVGLDPQNLLALFRLESLARLSRDLKLLAACLENIIGCLADSELKLAYAVELAQIRLELLEDTEGCESALATAEKIQPDALPVLRLRQALALRKKDWAALVEAISRELKLTEEPKEMQALLLQKAEALLYGVGDLNQAADSYRQALEIPLSQFPILKSLEQLLTRTRDFEGYLKVVLAMEKLITPPDPRAPGSLVNRVYYASRRAFFSELALAKAELAVAAQSEVIRLKPDSLPALMAMGKILRAKRAGENFVKATELILTQARNLAELSILLYQAAWDFENLFNQPEKAAELWQQFNQAVQGTVCPGLLYEQRRLLYRSHDWPRLGQVLAAITEKIKNPRIATAFQLRYGFLAETFLGEPGQARAGYEKALHEGSAPLIFPALIELACFQADWESASALMKDFGRNLSQLFKAGLVWQSAMMLSEKSKAPAERILEELRVAEETGSSWLEKTSKVEFLRRSNDFSALSESLAELISLLDETKLIPYQVEYAWVLSRRTNQKDQAIEQYLKILTVHDNYLPAVRELEFLSLEVGHPRLMVQALAREISARTDQEILTFIYHWLSLVYEEDLKDNDRAIAALRSLNKLRPDWRPALSELRRLYGKVKAFKELVKIISSETALTEDPAQKLALFREQAAVFEQNLNDPEAAVNALLSAHALNPKDPAIIVELNRLYLHLEKWPELIETITKEIDLTTDAKKRAELQVQVGQLYDEKLHDYENSVLNYEQAEKTLPEFMPILRALERLYTRLNRFRELVRVLEKIQALTTDKIEQAEIINRVGKIYREKLNEIDLAIKSHLRVLELVPENQTALESLVVLYREKADSSNLVKVQEKLAEVLKKTKPELARKLLMEAGQVYEKDLANQNSAINCYRKAAALAPDDLAPVRAEKAIFERRQDFKEVVRLMETEVKILPSPNDKKLTLSAIGNLCEQKIQDPELAARYYQAALKLDPEYIPAVRPLAEIYYRRQAWPQAEPLYAIWVKALNQEKPDRQAEILYNFGVVLEKLNKMDNALECFQAASQRKAHYLEPLSRLYEIFLARGEKQKAAHAGQELVAALEPTGDQKRLFSILSSMGALEKELNQNELAIEYLERALNIDQNHYPSLRLAADIYRSQKNWPKALSTYDRMVRAAGTPDLVSRGLLEKGEILEKELNQRDSAIAHYRKAVEVKPDYLMGWRSLASALKLDKKWQDAAIAFQKIIDLEPNPKNKIEDIYGLGIIYRDGFGDLNRARESFEKALSLDKMHVPSMEAILSIYLKSKQWEKYIELSQRFISLIPKTEEKKAALLHYQRGQVLRDFLNDRQKAVAEFQSAIRLDPDNIPARVELAELYAKETNSYPLAIREHQEIISRDLFRLQSYHQMGMLYELLGKLDEAFCCYKVLQLFKTANRDETMFLEANEAQVTRSSNKTLGDDMQYRLLSHPDCRGPLLEIIAEIGDYLADVLPPQLEKTGANKSNKVPANSTVGYKKLVDELALNLGISAYDLYMVPQQTEPRVVATEPPSLVINADWLNHLRETERRFILGKYLLHLKLRHGIIFNNQLAEVFRAVMLFVWLVVPEVRVPGVAESDLEKMAKPIKRAVPRKVRAALEEKAKILAREGLPKAPAEWLRGVHLTGHFAGMLLANDLMESLSAVLRLDNRYKNVNLKDLGDPRSVLEQSEDAKELLRFWVSETFFTLRKRAGFSLLST